MAVLLALLRNFRKLNEKCWKKYDEEKKRKSKSNRKRPNNRPATIDWNIYVGIMLICINAIII
jgi:hypothetical protein